MDETWITTKEVAEMLGVKRNTVHQWIFRKVLPFNYYKYVGGSIRIKKQDVIDYLEKAKK